MVITSETVVSLTDKAKGGLVVIPGETFDSIKFGVASKPGETHEAFGERKQNKRVEGRWLPLQEKPSTCSLYSGLSIVSATTFRRFTQTAQQEFH